MNNSVLLHHFDVWVNDINYEGYKSDGIVASEHVSYDKLISTIVEELKIDEAEKIEARYIVNGNAASLLIHNEMNLKLDIEIKKSECGFGTYPLIITTLDKSANELLFDGKVDAVRCLENPSEKVAEFISYKSNCSASLPLFDMKGNKIISDCKHSDVKVRQIYKDKCTLISAMTSYAVEHSFNFYAKRSDKKSYVLRCRLEDYVWIIKDYASEGLDSLRLDFFQDVHTCPLKDQVFTQLQGIVGFVSDFVAPKFINYKRIQVIIDLFVKTIFGCYLNIPLSNYIEQFRQC